MLAVYMSLEVMLLIVLGWFNSKVWKFIFKMSKALN